MLTKLQFAKLHQQKFGKVSQRRVDHDYLIYTLKHAKVEMYYKPSCIYCQKAKELLTYYHIPYMTYNVTDRHLLNHMVKRSQRQTVPQIFVNHHHIGGYTDLEKLLKY